MRTKFRGWYKPTAEEFRVLWTDGIVVLDANVLLAAYRLSTPVRTRLFDTIEAFGSRIWVPFQAAREYQENRLTVIQAQRATYEEVRNTLRSAEANLLGRRRDHPVLDPNRFRDLVRRSLAAIGRYIDEVEQEHPNLFGEDPLDDAVRDRWDSLLAECVGDPLSLTPEWKKKADERYAKKVPPGFEDAKKPEEGRGYGDLILWCELLEEVRSRATAAAGSVAVIFVTDDSKGDWWQSYQGKQLGPRPELVKEIQDIGGMPFWMYRLTRFLRFAAEHLRWEPLEAVSDIDARDSGIGAAGTNEEEPPSQPKEPH